MSAPPMHSLPIRIWLPLSLLLIFTFLLAGLSWLHLSDIRASVVADTQDALRSQIQTLQHHVEEEVRTSGLESIQDEFALLATQPEITTSALISSEGEILTGMRLEWRSSSGESLQDFDPEAFAEALRTQRSVWRWLHDYRTLTVYYPVSLPSTQQLRPGTGVLFIGYDNSHRMALARSHTLNRFLIILGASVTALALLMWLLRGQLLRPLGRLDRALQAFGSGQHGIRLPTQGGQELGALARAFNDMADAQQRLVEEVDTGRQNLAATLDSIGDAVIVTDAQGRVTRMNSVAESLTGWPFGEASGRPIEDILVLVESVSRNTVPMPVRRALERGEVVQLANHTVLVRRDGSERHIADSAAPIRDGQGRIMGVIMVCRDVDDEHRLREALREREAVYRLMTEQTASFDYWIDTRGRYRYLSPACEDITGYGVGEFRQVPDFLEGITHPDDREMVRLHGAEVSRPGLPKHTMEFRIVNRQGQVRWLHHICQDVFSEDGNWLGRRSSNLDITERKQAEAALARHASDLEGLVAERTRQLLRSNEALAQASRAKDEFLAAMSHELRTPLTAILGLAGMLREQMHGPINPKQGQFLSQIKDSGHHLLELINDILDVAKIEAGKLTLQHGRVEVAKAVEVSLAMIREAAQAKGLRLSLAEDGRVKHLHGDARRIRQALVNLLSNAVKFTPGGGQIGLEVLGDEQCKVARFSVWDTGIGIAPEDQATLFQPFTQVDSRLSREYSGTGLGLVLVKHMAELHQGRVEMQSEPGKGSRFTLVLPWDPKETWEDLPEAEPATALIEPGIADTELEASRRVLLVDDNEVNREMAREFLEISGHTVITAGDGEEALARLREGPLPDIVLLDIQMPVMDGPTTLARLRADPRTASLTVVALTALAMSGDRDRLLAQGFDAYLAKPYQFEALQQVVLDSTRTRPRPPA